MDLLDEEALDILMYCSGKVRSCTAGEITHGCTNRRHPVLQCLHTHGRLVCLALPAHLVGDEKKIAPMPLYKCEENYRHLMVALHRLAELNSLSQQVYPSLIQIVWNF